MQEILHRVRPRPTAAHVLVHAEQGFTANVPLADLDRPEVLLATHHDGQPFAGRPRISATPNCSASLCLEICKVAASSGISRSRRRRILGTKRIPHVRRSVERTAV
jgi:hypothetical protein